MSTYVLMRILESAPRRYELGIRLLTFGRIDRAYDRLTSRVEAGQRVLDLGCGTGALALRAARRGARVKAIDVSPEMLAIAGERARADGLAESVELAEMGVAELDGEPANGFDVVTSGLCLSELSPDERSYALRQLARVLRPGGLVLVGDEVRPSVLHLRLLHALLKAPLAAITYLITGQTTRAVPDLPESMRRAGLTLVSVRTDGLGSFMELVARKPAGEVP